MLTIVFDLDGTLVDTAPDLIETLNFTLKQHSLPTVPYDDARPLIGGGARTMIERALILEGRSATSADVDALYAPFVAHYAEHIADRSRPFPGLLPVLDRLAAAGHPLAVCTNKLERLSKRLLDALELSGRFAAICGQDTFGVQKPDPQMFRATMTAPAASQPAPSWSGIPLPISALRERRMCRWWQWILAIPTCRSRPLDRTGSLARLPSCPASSLLSPL